MKKGRLFLFDYLCFRREGHNLALLEDFSRDFRKDFAEIIIFTPKIFPFSENVEVRRELEFPYSFLFRRKNSVLFKFEAFFYRNWFRIKYIFSKDPIQETINKNLEELFQKFGINENDTIFFPSSDYYGCKAILDLINKKGKTGFPVVNFRLIAVAEFYRFSKKFGKKKLDNSIFKVLKEGILANPNLIKLSCETMEYQRFLKEQGLNAFFFPSPVKVSYKLIAPHRPLRIVFPGNARKDKGYFQILDIANYCLSNSTNTDFEFYVQSMEPACIDYSSDYELKLKNHPNIQLVDQHLSSTDFEELLKSADLFVLPYDKKIYKYRGSAILQRAIENKVEVITYSGLGFSDLVERYKVGFCCESFISLKKNLCFYLNNPAGKTMIRVSRLSEDYKKGKDEFLKC